MSKFRTALLAGAMVVGFGAAADAAQITGTLQFTGTGSFDATSLTVTLAAVNASASSGSFLGVFANGETVSFTSPLNFTATTLTPVGLIWSIDDWVNQASFTTSAAGDGFGTVATAGGFSFLTIVASGVLELTGYDPTPGTLLISSQGQPNGGVVTNVTFSATNIATPVPEPASLALLGIGLLGLGFAAHRRAA